MRACDVDLRPKLFLGTRRRISPKYLSASLLDVLPPPHPLNSTRIVSLKSYIRMPYDYTTRGRKDAHPLGTATFVGLRALDPFVQHSILCHGTGRALIESFGSKLNVMGMPLCV